MSEKADAPKNSKIALKSPFVVKQRKSRAEFNASGVVVARDVLKDFDGSFDLWGITKAQFSMLDLIQAILEKTGKADIAISTWTCGIYDADAIWNFVNENRIGGLRWVVDCSFFSGKESETKRKGSREFLAAFGAENIRAIDNHAKYTLIGNHKIKVTICSSMNLNKNKRLESFQISANPDVYDFYIKIIDQIFAETRTPFVGMRHTREELKALLFEDEKEESAGWNWD